MRKIITLLLILSVLFFTMGTLNASETITQAEKEVKGVLKKVSPSIVKVVSENHKRYVATGIATAPNRIISSIMVTRYPYQKIYIKTVKGDEYQAKVLGKDRETSLILLEIDKKALIPIRKAKNFEVGDWIALVGAFYKRFPSIYQGIVSSVSDEALILNAPVAPGSSGGAVVNKKGELMGVIRGRFGYTYTSNYIYKDHSSELRFESPRSRYKDLCYAIPVAKVTAVAHDLGKYGEVRRGWLGVSLIPSLKGDIPKVGFVTKNSPAEKAGIRKGDGILEIEGKPVRNRSDLVRIFKSLKPGQKAKIELLRGKMKKSVLAVIGDAKSWNDNRPFSTFADKDMIEIPEISETLPKVENFVVHFSGSRTLGVDVMAITPELAEKFNVKGGNGLMISKVSKNTAAEKAGFQAADIIVRAGSKKIKQLSDLRRVLYELEDNETVVIDVFRNGKLKKIKVVPDKSGQRVINFLDRFRDKLRDINIKVDDENRITIEEVKKWKEERGKWDELQKKYAKEAQRIKEGELKRYKEEIEKMKKIRARAVKETEVLKEKELKKYREEMERMKKVQEELKKEMEKMRKLIEMEKKKQKTVV